MLDKQGLQKKIEDVDKKIPNASDLVKMTDCNTKITETENKIPTATSLVAAAALSTKATEIEKKFPEKTLKVKYLTLLIYINSTNI